ESECAGIADVQAHDVAACGFQVTRPMTEGAADLVADFVEAGTGRNGSLGHVGLRKKNFRMVTAAMMQCTGTSRPGTQPIACCMHPSTDGTFGRRNKPATPTQSRPIRCLTYCVLVL